MKNYFLEKRWSRTNCQYSIRVKTTKIDETFNFNSADELILKLDSILKEAKTPICISDDEKQPFKNITFDPNNCTTVSVYQGKTLLKPSLDGNRWLGCNLLLSKNGHALNILHLAWYRGIVVKSLEADSYEI